MAIINKKQFRTVLILQGVLICFCLVVGFGFWGSFCNFSLDKCLSWKSPWTPLSFLALAAFRPALFTPTIILAMLAGTTFSVEQAVLLTATGATVSTLIPYFVGKYLSINGVRPWLSSNLPATWQLVRTQDYKIVFFSRWLSVFPYDISSLFFGALSFRLGPTLLASFVGVLPESYIFVKLATSDSEGGVFKALGYLAAFGLITLLPLIIFEVFQRKQGSTLWTLLKSTYYEIVYEIQTNNQIVRRREYDSEKPIIVLLYGFFSSRKALTIMERLLTQRGFQVMSFNLGGVLGVFFTKGIRETAEYIDKKIRRQLSRNNLKKIHIVGHSKGGLVGLWLCLKLNGSDYCQKIITMGSPFNGTYLTYLGLISPLGLFWRDLWQMRPGSQFYKELNEAEIPSNVEIFCLYSKRDKISGKHGCFNPPKYEKFVEGIAMDNIAHFEFLYKREVADQIARLLRKPGVNKRLPPSEYQIIHSPAGEGDF